MKKKKKHFIETVENGIFSTESAKNIEDLQWTKYANEKSGHGFTAEDANALNDKLSGKKVNKVGINNKKNGADRIVNKRMIQTKYYKSAEDSINSAFDTKTGLYRYKNQLLEVPNDQYNEAINKMSEKIKEGKVPGVHNPDEAIKIVKKGDVTYQQAKNIAKAGNIDSLIFDAKAQCVTTSYAFGISFVVQYANCLWNGMDKTDALKISVTTGLKTGFFAFSTGVITQQFIRTATGRSFIVFTSKVSKKVIDQLYKSDIGKEIIHKIATGVLGKKLVGAAAKNAVVKVLRTNIVTIGFTTTLTSIPDFYKALVSKKISWKQFSKNLSINIAGVAGGVAGSVAGATAGGTLGTMIFPGIGTVIGATAGSILGGLGIGIGASVGTKKLLDLISEDDAKKMYELVIEVASQLAIDYMITEDEFNNIIEEKINNTITPKWLENMYQSGHNKTSEAKSQYEYAYKELEPIFFETILIRQTVIMPHEKIVRKEFWKTYLFLFFEFIKIKTGKIFGKNNELLDV